MMYGVLLPHTAVATAVSSFVIYLPTIPKIATSLFKNCSKLHTCGEWFFRRKFYLISRNRSQCSQSCARFGGHVVDNGFEVPGFFKDPQLAVRSGAILENSTNVVNLLATI